MNRGNVIFVLVWLAAAIVLLFETAWFPVAAFYALTGAALASGSGGSWRTVVGWMPAFMSPKIYAWTRREVR